MRHFQLLHNSHIPHHSLCNPCWYFHPLPFVFPIVFYSLLVALASSLVSPNGLSIGGASVGGGLDVLGVNGGDGFGIFFGTCNASFSPHSLWIYLSV